MNQKPFNIGMPVQGMTLKKRFHSPEVMIRVSCDIHPWMTSYIGALPHPYFSVTNAEGRFEISNLPQGTYMIEAWHEVYGTQTQTLTLGPNDSQDLTFSFK